MAREEADREDLLREATALVARAEIRLRDEADSIVVGFRRGGLLSIYFGSDPAYHFNTAGELRRAFVDGMLIKAQNGRLVQLDRQRTETEVLLASRVLADEEQRALLDQLGIWLDKLFAALRPGAPQTIAEIPTGCDVVVRVVQWLARRPRTIPVAHIPNAGRD